MLFGKTQGDSLEKVQRIADSFGVRGQVDGHEKFCVLGWEPLERMRKSDRL